VDVTTENADVDVEVHDSKGGSSDTTKADADYDQREE
jgi:hypothetical protein